MRLGADKRLAVRLALLATAFAILPDLDIVFASDATLRVLLARGTDAGAFDGTVHRGVTHALPVAAVTVAIACGIRATSDVRATTRTRTLTGLGTGALLAGLLGVVATDGVLNAIVVGAFTVSAGALAILAGRFDISTRAVAFASGIGLLLHPFGDVFTGQPPAMFYPLVEVPLFDRLVVVPGDPTANLLAVILIELTCVWACFYATLVLRDWNPRTLLRREGAVGVAYACVLPFIAPPTIHAPHLFVYALVGLAAVSGLPAIVQRSPAQMATTGLVATTLGVVAYALAYEVALVV